METKENPTIESPIEQALAKENVTAQVIQKLKTYLGLKINGIDDKAGFKAVEDARKECKAIRVLAEKICKKGREEAIKIQKDWIAKEKEVVASIEEVENALELESDRIKKEKERILFEAAQREKLPIRKEKLFSIGVEVEDDELLKIDDNQFNTLFNEFHEKILAEKAEKLRLEQEQIEAERKEAARIEAARLAEIKRQEDLKKAAEEARIKAENEAKEAIEKAKREKEEAEQKAIEAAKKAEQDKKDALIKAEKEKQEAIAKLKAEQEAKKAAEEKAKQEAIDAENKRIEAEKKKAAKAPDKEKLKDFMLTIKCDFKGELKSIEASKVIADINVKFAAFKKWANDQIETI